MTAVIIIVVLSVLLLIALVVIGYFLYNLLHFMDGWF